MRHIRVPARRLWATLAVALFAGPLFGATAKANDLSPSEWLARMSTALTDLEYEGTLVYLHGHELSALRIAHRIDDGQARESLLALSGPVRAVARDRREVTCVLPDAHAILVPRNASGGRAALKQGPFDVERLNDHYLVHPLGRSRIAGRDTQVIGIIPRDDLRYGYRFYIDEETGLPLKTDLMDASATPIEQVMFTEVEFIGDDEESMAGVASARSASKAPRHSPVSASVGAARPQVSEPGPSADGAEISLSPWRLSELPAGYRVVDGDEPRGPREGARRWYMVSDGLAVVSVYIEEDRGHGGLDGQRQVGALNAAGRLVDGHQVTVVGEVPTQTVQAIADAVVLERR
jgi:sigma-E factor negative regulatory protein RseB